VGNTTSDDYAPAANSHGFAYAVDFEGNWKWGKFFYNVSYAISTIQGCKMDANNHLVLMGEGNSAPVIMRINPLDGSVLGFLSLDKIATSSSSSSTTTSWYKFFGAIHHDI
jgi:hypothetical protein